MRHGSSDDSNESCVGSGAMMGAVCFAGDGMEVEVAARPNTETSMTSDPTVPRVANVVVQRAGARRY